MNIVEEIKQIKDLGCIDGCSEEQVREAEELLDLKFPSEYVDYVRAYGCIDFGFTEWTGLNIKGELNTVDATLAEREYNESFPKKYFVLDDGHIDARKIIVNEEGKVFLLQHDVILKVSDSISEYLDYVIKNNR